MSWRDEDIDKLFQENAANTTFEYKNEYWKEFEAASLPVNKNRKDFLWVGTAIVFLGIMTTMSVYNPNGMNSLDGNKTLTAGIEESKITDPSVDQSINNEGTRKDQLNGSERLIDRIDLAANEAINVTSINRSNQISNRESSIGTTEKGALPNSSSNRVSELTLPIGFNNPTEVPVALLGAIKSNGDDLGEAENDFTVNSLLLRELENDLSKSQAPGFNFKMPPIELRTAVLLYFELNGGLSESIVSPSDQYSNSFGAGVGVEIQRNKFNLIAGVNGVLSNHKDIQLNRRTLVYGFGSELMSTQLNYSEIYSIEGNLSLGYNFGKHVLSIGVRPSYAVGSKVRDQRVINDILVHDIEGYGYMDGLKRFGLKPQIGYAYKFNHGFTLGANLGLQTQESLNEDFINGENNRMPIDGQVYFRKSIRLRN